MALPDGRIQTVTYSVRPETGYVVSASIQLWDHLKSILRANWKLSEVFTAAWYFSDSKPLVFCCNEMILNMWPHWRILLMDWKRGFQSNTFFRLRWPTLAKHPLVQELEEVEEPKLNTELENSSWDFPFHPANESGIEISKFWIPPADTKLKLPSPGPATVCRIGTRGGAGIWTGTTRGDGGREIKLLQGFWCGLAAPVCNLFVVTS